MDYKSAGVDIEAGYRSVELMKEYVARTAKPEVIGGIGGFAGAFALDRIKEMKHPVLLSGTDGVGTKIQLAFLTGIHDTVGIDCVAMCVNDIVCAGGEPLFFLDYIACGRNDPEVIASIVKGVSEGCVQAGCALIGGETAEHPGLMPEDEYDLAGFTVGVADRDLMIDGSSIAEGDVLIGVASSGIHSNGFSLVRKVFGIGRDTDADSFMKRGYDELDMPLYKALLAPTRIYVNMMKSVIKSGVTVKGVSHITGGGFQENIPRMLPEGMSAVVRKDSYELPPLFSIIRKEGNIEEDMMYNTFNMGVGMVLAVNSADADRTVEAVKASGEKGFYLGEVIKGERGVSFR